MGESVIGKLDAAQNDGSARALRPSLKIQPNTPPRLAGSQASQIDTSRLSAGGSRMKYRSDECEGHTG
jgi:hypothetical protein